MDKIFENNLNVIKSFRAVGEAKKDIGIFINGTRISANGKKVWSTIGAAKRSFNTDFEKVLRYIDYTDTDKIKSRKIPLRSRADYNTLIKEAIETKLIEFREINN